MKKLLSKLVCTIVFFMCISVHAQRGLGTNNPEKSAILELKSTTKGFLPPRMTSAQLLTLKNNAPLAGLMVYCTDCSIKDILVFDGDNFIGLIGSKTTPTQVKEVKGPTGRIWMDRNLGASQVATASDDPLSYGDFYQWGTATIAGSGASINGVWDVNGGNTNNLSWSNGSNKGLQDPCPAGFRVPTASELDAERNMGGTSFWGTGNAQNEGAAGAFTSALKLSAAGYLLKSGAYVSEGSRGLYWSSSSAGGDNRHRLLFSSTSANVNNSGRAHGFSVRCIKEFEFLTVTSTTGKVWMDRNLGATQVATSSTDAASYGDLYQWGRNKDGHEQRNSATASGPLASGSEGVNFITNSTSPSDWLTPQDNGRWGATKTANDPCPTGFRVPTGTELEAERNNGGTGFWGTGSAQNNAAGAFASVLKLPVAGGRNNSNGALDNVSSRGLYWSSAVVGANARYLSFGSSDAYLNLTRRAHAFTLRCIKD